MYESWIEAERFYTLFMPWTIIGLAVLVFVYILFIPTQPRVRS